MTVHPQDLLTRFCGPTDPEPPPGSPAILVIVAHPDDEVIGAGVRLAQWHDHVAMLHVTDGAPRNGVDARAAGFESPRAYAAARSRELKAALALLEVPTARSASIGLADQEVSLHLAPLAERLAVEIPRWRPDIVLTHAYEGGHPDHDAVAFAVHAACARLAAHAASPPVIFEMTGYHWSGTQMVTGEFVPRSGEDVRAVPLSAAEQALKQRLFGAFTTQRAVLQYFGTEVERFRVAPAYDFTAPPHAGSLFYEFFDWGVNGLAWRQRATAAWDQLGLCARTASALTARAW